MNWDAIDMEHAFSLVIQVLALVVFAEVLWGGFYWFLGAFLLYRVVALLVCWAVMSMAGRAIRKHVQERV